MSPDATQNLGSHRVYIRGIYLIKLLSKRCDVQIKDWGYIKLSLKMYFTDLSRKSSNFIKFVVNGALPFMSFGCGSCCRCFWGCGLLYAYGWRRNIIGYPDEQTYFWIWRSGDLHRDIFRNRTNEKHNFFKFIFGMRFPFQN